MRSGKYSATHLHVEYREPRFERHIFCIHIILAFKYADLLLELQVWAGQAMA